uniref:Uncharacterized protein n=1 Tax=Xiphophorus maculatus TaxID=8083 RepID=A0A3B5QEQ9_XIPMA
MEANSFVICPALEKIPRPGDICLICCSLEVVLKIILSLYLCSWKQITQLSSQWSGADRSLVSFLRVVYMLSPNRVTGEKIFNIWDKTF